MFSHLLLHLSSTFIAIKHFLFSCYQASFISRSLICLFFVPINFSCSILIQSWKTLASIWLHDYMGGFQASKNWYAWDITLLHWMRGMAFSPTCNWSIYKIIWFMLLLGYLQSFELYVYVNIFVTMVECKTQLVIFCRLLGDLIYLDVLTLEGWSCITTHKLYTTICNP